MRPDKIYRLRVKRIMGDEPARQFLHWVRLVDDTRNTREHREYKFAQLYRAKWKVSL